jgi:N-methylhydantoinase A
VVDAKMADLVRRMSLLRGLDPRRFTCAAFGGGGPLHSPAVAAQAGIGTLIVPLPRAASVWSAFGAATSDIAHVFQRWMVLHLPVSGGEVEPVFAALEAQAHTTLERQGAPAEGVELVRSLRMRFSMQIHDVEVPVAPGAIDDARMQQIDADFEEIHEQLFGRGSGFRAGGVDITGFQVRATARTTKPRLAVENGAAADPTATREIYWPELRAHRATPIFSAAPPQPVAGPALIELPDTVIAVRPGHTGARDGAGNYVIDLGRAA